MYKVNSCQSERYTVRLGLKKTKKKKGKTIFSGITFKEVIKENEVIWVSPIHESIVIRKDQEQGYDTVAAFEEARVGMFPGTDTTPLNKTGVVEHIYNPSTW